MGIFQESDQWEGAPENVRRSLSHVKRSPQLDKLDRACAQTKLSYEFCSWRKDAWAHFIFPNQRVAIIAVACSEIARNEIFRAPWIKQGWRCLIIRKADINSCPSERLFSDMMAALKPQKVKK